MQMLIAFKHSLQCETGTTFTLTEAHTLLAVHAYGKPLYFVAVSFFHERRPEGRQYGTESNFAAYSAVIKI